MSKKYILGIVLMMLGFQCQQTITEQTVEKGVPLTLATERKANISDINYQLSFDIPAEKSKAIPASLKISFTLKNADTDLYLDFKEAPSMIKSVEKEGSAVAYQLVNEHLIIPNDLLKVGQNVFEISFQAGELSLNRNDDFLYTLLVPDRARTLFPLFDQPNLKATYQLQLNIPNDWKAVSNGKMLDTSPNENKTLIRFEKTKAISSYLFAFAAGKFQTITDPKSGMTMYHRETDTVKVNRNAPEIFDLHQKSLAWLEEYTNIDYPYPKFDFVLIPPFQYGGMEHPGSIFYREASLFLDEGATINQQLRRASLIAHETAHMWFGNLVTMDWFNDVWLKEVFANQMASKIMHPSFPEVNHDLNFLLSYYPRALVVDRSEGTHPIQQSLDNLQNAGTLYGNIIYNKAPIVMRNLERLMGKDAFQEAIRRYLTQYATDNATWDDLIDIMKQYTEKDLQQWNQDWIKGKGVPSYSTTFDDNRSHMIFRQTVTIGDQVWPQEVSYSAPFSEDLQDKVFLEESVITVPNKNGNRPTFVNVNGNGYGYFQWDQSQWQELLSIFSRSEKEVERAAFWLNTWEGTLNGDLVPIAVLEALLAVVPEEKNSLILSYQLNRISDIFWQLLGSSDQPILGEKIEKTLLDLILVEENTSLKRLLYNGLVRNTYSQKGGLELFKIWKSSGSTIDLKLSETESVNLSYQIFLRGVEGSDDILVEQLKKVKNADRKKQMEFVSQALAKSEEERDLFFESLTDPENRASEPWVLQALGLLHHPLQQASSQKYVLPSLEMIEEIQETGDIFFPARWLNSTLNPYNKKEVANQVRQFLSDHPDLSPKLKNKVLQAADGLIRASEIKDKTAEGNL